MNITGSTQAIRTGAAATIAGGFASAQDALFGTANAGVVFVVVVTTALVISQVIATLFEKALDSWGFLRGLLLSRHNIEGFWTDVVRINGADVVGVLNISLNAEDFCIHGVQYDEHGHQVASWKNVLLKFDGQNLRYLYETRYQDPNVTQFGYSEMTFLRTGSRRYPDCCNGHFLDLANPGTAHAFHAIRQSREFVSLFGRNPSAAVLGILSARQIDQAAC